MWVTVFLAYRFSQNVASFPSSFGGKCRPGQCVLRYSRTRKRLCRLYKQEVQKFEELIFFQKG